MICTWDPFNNVIVSEIDGNVKFENIIEGITYREEADEQTGHREKVVIETKDKTRFLLLSLKVRKKSKAYNLPVGISYYYGRRRRSKSRAGNCENPTGTWKAERYYRWSATCN